MIWYSLETFQPDQTTILYIGRDLYGQPIFGDYVLDPPFVKIFCEERRYRYSGTLYTKLNSLITMNCLNFSYEASHYGNLGTIYKAAIFRYTRGEFRYLNISNDAEAMFTRPYFISEFA